MATRERRHLTKEERDAAILAAVSKGESQRAVAERFGVDQMTVNRAKHSTGKANCSPAPPAVTDQDGKTYLEAAGIEVKPASEGGLTWHSTRHTFITRLTENGSNIGTVKELARHSTITMTNDYVHVASDTNQLALDALCETVDLSALFPVTQARGGHLRDVSA